METKVLDDGLTYARIQSRDRKKDVHFMTVCVDHIRNRDSLREQPRCRGFKRNSKTICFHMIFLECHCKAGLRWYMEEEDLARDFFFGVFGLDIRRFNFIQEIQ